MPPSERKLPASIVGQLYANHRGTHIKCSCCRKPLGDDSAYCSRCESATYCSKKCQCDHWKEHKKHCPKSLDQQAILLIRARKRAERFQFMYGPVVSMACAYANAYHHCGDARVTQQTHVMMVHLGDLPGTAKKPRLRVDKILPKRIDDLPDYFRTQMLGQLAIYPNPARTQGYFIVYQGENMDGPLMRCIISSYPDDLIDDAKKEERRTLLSLVLAWIETANDMAKGQRPDLIALITKSGTRS